MPHNRESLPFDYAVCLFAIWINRFSYVRAFTDNEGLILEGSFNTCTNIYFPNSKQSPTSGKAGGLNL